MRANAVKLSGSHHIKKFKTPPPRPRCDRRKLTGALCSCLPKIGSTSGCSAPHQIQSHNHTFPMLHTSRSIVTYRCSTQPLHASQMSLCVQLNRVHKANSIHSIVNETPRCVPSSSKHCRGTHTLRTQASSGMQATTSSWP